MRRKSKMGGSSYYWLAFFMLFSQGCFCPHTTEAKTTKQQFFVVKPQDNEVGQGGKVVISCEVGDRRGRVQWTKDGLTLGYDRKLPGFPRYAVLGSDDSGVFNLEISNATLEDDAVYECQVGPSLNNRPIRASARLSVMLPPTKIEIEGVKAGSRMSVRENEVVELKCVVRNAKPKAIIVWFRENSEYYSESRQDVDEKGPDERVTSISTIKFRPTSSDNGVTWACEADHPALANSPLRTTVLLSVLHPPGPPEITGYIEGETILLGQTVTLVCRAAGGNPLAEISWYRNGIKVDSSYTTSGRDSSNTYSFLAATEDNNAKFRCESRNELSTEPLTAEIVLSVQFAPNSVELRGPREARAGEEVSFECSTSSSNPPATIQWIVDNVTVIALQNRTVSSPLGGWITHSNVSIKVRPSDRNKVVSCNVINSELNAIKTESAILTVIYPPGPPQIQGLNDDEVLTAGSLKRLTCTSISGNPLATLKWFNGDKELVSIYLTRDNYASAEVAFVPKGSDNGGQLRCEASNVASAAKPLVATRNLTVDFAPEFAKITVRPDRPRAGSNATLVCESASSYPAASITWWTNGEKLEGATEMVVDGAYGGFVTSSHLQLALTPQHHGVEITCDASNGIANQRAHDAVLLSIAHKPIFNIDTDAIELIEGSMASVNLTASANPLPIEYEWLKLDGELQKLVPISSGNDHQSRLSVSGGVLNLTRVERLDSGYYTVAATNAEGTTQTKIKIDVLYAPRITDITTSVLVGQGEPAHLECAVDAYPMGENIIRWERAGYDMASRTKTTMGSPTTTLMMMESSSTSVNSAIPDNQKNIGVVLLTVLNATAADSGEFWCVASNGVGGRAARNASYLLVRHKPIIKKNPLTYKSAADIGETARLTCEARGVPNVTFYWAKAGGQRLAEGSKYEMNSRMVDPLTWQSEFFIANVTSLDYGGYECVARNSEGTTAGSVYLDVKSRPEPPSGIRAVNITHRAVKLEWSPGFHGGMDQHFRVMYKPTKQSDGSPAKYWDVYPANAESAVISDLQPGVEYVIDVMSFNNLGESNFTFKPVVITTASRPPRGSREQLYLEALEEKGDIPTIIIVASAGCLTFFLLLNIVLIVVCLRRHKKKQQLKANGGGQQKAPSEGSASSGSTKSATMELYTSSYNETMSGGGETLSSISEKSCISSANQPGHGHHGQQSIHGNGFLSPQAYLMEEDNLPYSRSTYLIDPPTSMAFSNKPYVEDPMSLYSVVHKDRKRSSMIQQDTNSESPCSIEQHMNYEDTESEYASELRRQTYLQKIGDHGGYSRNSHIPSVSSVYSNTLPHIQVYPQGGQPQRPRHVRLSTELDLDYSPLTTPIVIETSNSNSADGPICASSPKRTVSAFTTFGPSRSNVTTPLSPSNSGSPPFGNHHHQIQQQPRNLPNSPNNGGRPATGHLV